MPRNFYMIAVTARTGSSWLCDMLTSTGVAGSPREHLWYRFSGENLKREWSKFDEAYPFGTKLVYGELTQIWKILTSADRIACHIVWMRRKDRMAQAVSMYRARESDCWSHRRGQEIPQSHRTVHFDAERIMAHYWDLETQDQQLGRWLHGHEVPFIQVWYEDLVDNAERVVKDILQFLKLPTDVPLQTGSHICLADDISQDWMERMSLLQQKK